MSVHILALLRVTTLLRIDGGRIALEDAIHRTFVKSDGVFRAEGESIQCIVETAHLGSKSLFPFELSIGVFGVHKAIATDFLRVLLEAVPSLAKITIRVDVGAEAFWGMSDLHTIDHMPNQNQ